MLRGAADPLLHKPCRVLIAGTSGSGKTTLARRVGELLELPHTEIDALAHGAGWVRRPTFVDDVRALATSARWVTEWQYAETRALLAAHADLVVWLDVPRVRTMTQVVRRTLRRRVLREVLWNGNVEAPLRTFLTDPDHVVRWAWRTHPLTRQRVEGLLADRPELPVVRLRSHAEATAWLQGPLHEVARR